MSPIPQFAAPDFDWSSCNNLPPVPRADFDIALDVIRSATDERVVICDLLGVDPMSEDPEERPSWRIAHVLEELDDLSRDNASLEEAVRDLRGFYLDAEARATVAFELVAEAMRALGIDPEEPGSVLRVMGELHGVKESRSK